MLPVERIIGEEGLAIGADGIRLAMRLPWYRSLPFSTVEIGSVTIDGDSMDLSDARVEFDGESWPLAEQGERIDTFWFVRDSAFLVLPGVSLDPDAEHRVDLVINVSPPYIPGMKRSNLQSEALRAA